MVCFLNLPPTEDTMSHDLIPIRRALISVSDKTGLTELAKALAKFNVEIVSTGGTAKAIEAAGVKVVAIDQLTGFPEMMDGRLKTLHPKVHGGLLGVRDNPGHAKAMKDHGIQPIDLVVVNLYPFEKTVAKQGVQDEEAIENIDIGGPGMVRSASKNHHYVSVLTDAAQYEGFLKELEANQGSVSLATRKKLAAQAFARTAAYDTAISAWMLGYAGEEKAAYPATLSLKYTKVSELRYGENPHQSAAVYADQGCKEPSVVSAKQLYGKELSYNNLNDAAASLELVKELARPAAAVIKHTNPCGLGVGESSVQAFERAYSGDPMAAFGGIVAFNTTVDLAAAKALTDGQKFLEVILAPDYTAEAFELITQRWKTVRVLELGKLPLGQARDASVIEYKSILGGLLAQQRDLADMTSKGWTLAAGPQATATQMVDLELAWAAVKHLKSNAICIVNNGALAGAGAGQMDRVESCKIAVAKANANGQTRSQGGVAGSDAFFPFGDGPAVLIKAGVKAIVQPGGSKRDDETIKACNEAGVALYFTGRRHFRH